MPILRLKDENGNVFDVPALVGPPGPKGADGTMTFEDLTDEQKVSLKGDAGANGKDGVSCTHSWNGTTLTVTSASGTSSANLKGEPGKDGANGSPGAAGANATINGVNTLTIKAGTGISLSQSGSTLTINSSASATSMTVAQIRAICT